MSLLMSCCKRMWVQSEISSWCHLTIQLLSSITLKDKIPLPIESFAGQVASWQTLCTYFLYMFSKESHCSLYQPFWHWAEVFQSIWFYFWFMAWEVWHLAGGNGFGRYSGEKILPSEQSDWGGGSPQLHNDTQKESSLIYQDSKRDGRFIIFC